MKRLGLVVVSLLFALNLLADIHGVGGGLVVQLGGNASALSNHWKTDGYIFQCLETSDDKVSNARNIIHKSGMYGKVSAAKFDGKKLPYADNLVNLLVVAENFNISKSEMERVLAPNGKMHVVSGFKSRVSSFKKAWPSEIDEWTHFLHGADNNAVANDSIVGPPKRVQWTAGPLWLRSHETESGIPAVVTAQGRLFYIFDEGPVGIVDNRLPEQWAIIARDAFNGVKLWRRELPDWGWREYKEADLEGKDLTVERARRTKFPRSHARRLVAVGDKVYTTLGQVAPLSVLDAASGKILHTLENTEGTDEILCGEGILLLCIRDLDMDAAARRGKTIPTRLAAYDTKTFQLLWEKETDRIGDLDLAMGEGKVVFGTKGKRFCVEATSGKNSWKNPISGTGGTLVIQAGKVVTSNGPLITAYSLQSGEKLWEDHEQKTLNPEQFNAMAAADKKKKNKGSGIKRGAASADLFVIDGKVWRGKPKYSLDLETGRVLNKANDHNLYSQGHHDRCYRGKATPRFLMSAQEGVEMMGISGDMNSQNNWVRGSCKYGILPANGLMYVPPDQCFCEPGVKFLGFGAFAPETKNPVKPSNPLEKGPAYGNLKTETGNLKPENWNTYRGCPARSGSSKTTVATKVSTGWKTDIGGKLSQPVSADGKVFIAAVDAHTLYALDANTGKELWAFTAGGRIDSPPTIHNGTAIFGSADGWVYSVRASDGVLAWRFRAAPEERLVGAFNQLESAWPVHGAVLVQNGVLYCQAGRSSFVDDGIFLYSLDPATGKKLNQTCVNGPHPNMKETPGQCFYLDGTRTEILVGDGDSVYMRNRQFDNALKMAPYEFLSSKGSFKMGRHIFSTASFLDDSWYNRAFWMHSETWPDFYHANQAPKSGQLLVFDDSTTYGVKVFHRRNCHSPMFFPGEEGYLLFADDNDNEPVLRDTDDALAIEWLPQNEYKTGKGMTGLDAKALDFDKGVGFTRAKPAKWTSWVPVRVQAMAKTSDKLFCAGQPDVFDENDPFGALQGRKGGVLLTVSAKDGKTLAEQKLDVAPISDGLIAANGKIFMAMKDGSVRCFE